LIIDNYRYTGNYLILIFHDAYDVITKTTDNSKIDESEEVYEYVLCAICPVSLTEPGLRYFEEENKIKARVRDWVVELPTNGFVFPAFIDRSTDVNSIMYYTKNPKDTHPELMEDALGCSEKQTVTIQKETFQEIIKGTFSHDEVKADKIFMEVQDNLSTMIEEYNSTYEDTDIEPITLTNKEIKNLLIESGVPEELTAEIEKSYVDSFGEDLPLAESLIDAKAVKANAQRRKEEKLQKQVELLQNKLEEVKLEAAIAKEPQQSTGTLADTMVSKEFSEEALNNGSEATLGESAEVNPEETSETSLENHTEANLGETLETNLVENSEGFIEEAEASNSESENMAQQYDVILKVKPEKIPHIKAQIIDGQKCIVIPINENEQAKVNDLEDLI